MAGSIKIKNQQNSSAATTKRTRGSSLAEYVRVRVREAIEEGRYEPGERVLEHEVAQWLKVSRTPVREGLRNLESEGLVNFQPRRGVVVAELDQKQVLELYAVRETLEGLAARLAAQTMVEREIDILEELLIRADKCIDDPIASARINKMFHQTICGASYNRFLVQMLKGLRSSSALLRGTTMMLPGRTENMSLEHRAIFEAIKQRDPDTAEKSMKHHIHQGAKARIILLLDLK